MKTTQNQGFNQKIGSKIMLAEGMILVIPRPPGGDPASAGTPAAQ